MINQRSSAVTRDAGRPFTHNDPQSSTHRQVVNCESVAMAEIFLTDAGISRSRWLGEIAINPADPDVMLVGSNGTCALSRDAGEHLDGL